MSNKIQDDYSLSMKAIILFVVWIITASSCVSMGWEEGYSKALKDHCKDVQHSKEDYK